jgi:alpha-ketoglutarate-dependent taurine dioxygenase
MADAELQATRTAGSPPLFHAPGETSGRDAAERAAALAREVREIVRRDGAVVVRGLGLRTPEELDRVSRALLTHRMVEREAFAPRRRHADCVYSASIWPPGEPMCLHHELSYAIEVPQLVLFACLRAPAAGGTTPLADSHDVLQALPRSLVARFEREGWLLTRNYNNVGLSWSEAFGTSDRTAVDEYCRRYGIDREWRPDGGLRTHQRRPAVVRHPVSGRPGWFNQVAFLNEWTLDPAVREYLVETYGHDELPTNTRYGDGRPVDAAVVQTINDTYDSGTLRLPWRDGDLLVVDNVRMAHGREAFEGPREVAVVMGEPGRLQAHSLA